MTFALFSAGTWCHQEVQGDGNYAYWSRPDETEDLASHQRGQKNQDQIENDDKNDGTRRVWRAAWDGRSFCGWLLFLAINSNLWNLKTLDTMGNSKIFTGLLFYAYVEIRQVRRLVFDNYQRFPVSLTALWNCIDLCIDLSGLKNYCGPFQLEVMSANEFKTLPFVCRCVLWILAVTERWRIWFAHPPRARASSKSLILKMSRKETKN